MIPKRDRSMGSNIRRIPKRSMQTLKQFYNRFLRIRGTPQQVALGLALGVFVGMTPFMGFHTVIAVMLASIVKWSKLAAGIGVFITNPFTAPFIYPLTYRLGVAVTGLSDPSRLRKLFEAGGLVDLLKSSPMMIVDLIVGGIVIGVPLAAITYFVAYHIVTRARRRLQRRKARRARLRALRSNIQAQTAASPDTPVDESSDHDDCSDRMAV